MPRSRQPNEKFIADTIKRLRIAADISQTQLGDALGVSFQQVQKYETGANRVTAAKLQTIAELFSVPITEFYPTPTNAAEQRTDPCHRLGLSHRGMRLARAFNAIPDGDVQESVVMLTEAIALVTGNGAERGRRLRESRVSGAKRPPKPAEPAATEPVNA